MNHMWSHGVKDHLWFMMSGMSTPTQFKLRVTPELKAKIDAACDQNGNSISSEINRRLEESFAMPLQMDALRSDIATLKLALQGAHAGLEAQSKLLRILSIPPEEVTAEMIRQNREALSGDAFPNAKRDLERLVDHLKKTIEGLTSESP